MNLLTATNLSGGYAEVDILHNLSLTVERGKIAVIVGPNGAGKSTVMRALLGLIELRSGQIIFEGQDITQKFPQERVILGISMVPQTRNIFVTLTVEENLEIGAYLHDEPISVAMEEVFSLFPILAKRRNQMAGQLSGGQRQQLALARALMMSPKLLLLDEPTAGLSPVVIDEVMARIKQIVAAGIAVVMVEQNAHKALEIADIGYVIVQGRNRFTGTGSELLSDPDVRVSFLGG